MARWTVRAAVLGWLISGGAAVAQPDDVQTEDAERRAPRVPGEVEAFSPVEDAGAQPTRPGLTAGESWETLLGDTGARAGAPLAERSFLNRVRGSVIAGPHGTRVLVTDASETGIPAALLLLPCGVLERFDEFVFKRNERVPAVVSGQVFVYDGRNYLMPSAIIAAAEEADPTEPVVPTAPEPNAAAGDADPRSASVTSPEDGDGASAAGSGSDPVREAEVEALLQELERRPVYPRRRAGRADAEDAAAEPARDAGGGNGTLSSGSPVAGAADSRYIAAQRGRMLRAADGSWLFAADNDAGLGTRMTLLPCRMLQAVEGVALREGDASAVLLSGRVFRYHGRDYLLPTLYQRERRVGVDPLQ